MRKSREPLQRKHCEIKCFGKAVERPDWVSAALKQQLVSRQNDGRVQRRRRGGGREGQKK